jgi:uncharacterized repeat protein (TIGR03803 family)
MSVGPQIATQGKTGYKSLYRFKGNPDGAWPVGANLINVKGALYGMSSIGGANNLGTVFKITTSGEEAAIYSFKGGADGAGPRGGLIDVNGTLYGTTRYGGGGSASNCGSLGCGTVFSVSTKGSEHVLHSFGSNDDGQNPYASLIDVKGTLYGTTLWGGGSGCGRPGGCGTVYKVSTTGKEKVLYSFQAGTDGFVADASLIDVSDTLYSTTQYGGGGGGSECAAYDGCGTVFSVSTSGTERVLYRFKGGTDGAYPDAALLDVNGTLYGTSGIGGGSGCGAGGCGTVFSMGTSGTKQLLYSFKGPPNDGARPFGNLIDVNGVLYGTTTAGGRSAACSPSGTTGCGAVFSVSTSGGEQMLYSFKGSPDGAFPQTSLIDVKGALYGTTVYGGAGGSECNAGNGAGCGTVFKLSP